MSSQVSSRQPSVPNGMGPRESKSSSSLESQVREGSASDNKALARRPDPTPSPSQPIHQRKVLEFSNARIESSAQHIRKGILTLALEIPKRGKDNKGGAEAPAPSSLINEAAKEVRKGGIVLGGRQKDAALLFKAISADLQFEMHAALDGLSDDALAALGKALEPMAASASAPALTPEGRLLAERMRAWVKTTCESRELLAGLEHVAHAAPPLSQGERVKHLVAVSDLPPPKDWEALQTAKDAVLAGLSTDFAAIAQLSPNQRGDLQLACQKLFGDAKANELFKKIDDHRLKAAKASLTANLTALYATSSDVRLQRQVAADVHNINQIERDAKCSGRTGESLAKDFSKTPPISTLTAAVVDSMAQAPGPGVQSALAKLEPLCKVLAPLSGFNGVNALYPAILQRLENVDMGRAGAQIEAHRAALPTDGVPASWISAGLQRAVPELDRMSKLLDALEVAEASFTALSHRGAPEAEAQAVQNLLSSMEIVRQNVDVNGPPFSQATIAQVKARLATVKGVLDGQARTILSPLLTLSLPQWEKLHAALKRLGPLAESSARVLNGQFASRLQTLTAHAQADLTRAVETLLNPAAKNQVASALAALDSAVKQEAEMKRWSDLAGGKFDPAAQRAEHLRIALEEAARDGYGLVPRHIPGQIRDVLALLTGRFRQAEGAVPQSPLENRLDAMSAFLAQAQRSLQMPTMGSVTTNPEDLGHMHAALRDETGISFDSDPPLDLRGFTQFVQEKLSEILERARKGLPGEDAAMKVSEQGRKDYERNSIDVVSPAGERVTLHTAATSSKRVPGAPAKTSQEIAAALHVHLGANANRLWLNSEFMTQELLGIIYGNYMQVHADSPLVRQFGNGAIRPPSGAPTDFESPRILRRLNTLRGLSHEQVEQVLT